MPIAYSVPAPVHLNGNMFCAVDTETTGLDPWKHGIIEVCVLPLMADYTINKAIVPFTMQMKPRDGKEIDPEAIRVNKIDLAWVYLNCIGADKASDLFVNWFEKLTFNAGKRIVPIAHNWPFDKMFLIDWLGWKTYELCFAHDYRDTMALAGSMNERADMLNMKVPHPKLNLKYLANQYNIENPDPHRALGDAATTAMLYPALLKAMI